MDDDFTKEMIIAVIEESELKNYLKKQCIGYLNKTDNSREEKRKAETIIKLQDQLRLSMFDLSEVRRRYQLLKGRYNSNKRTILKSKEELQTMKNIGDYTNIKKVINSLKDVGEEDDLN